MNDDIDFFEYIEQLKDINFCRKYLDLKKIFIAANSITKIDLDRVIHQTKCVNNPYRTYFSSSPAVQKELWQKLLIKLESDRLSFNSNP